MMDVVQSEIEQDRKIVLGGVSYEVNVRQIKK